MSDEQNIQANDKSVAVGKIEIGGNLQGNITIGNTGYTPEEVSILLTQITSTFHPKPFDGRCPYKGLDVFEEEDAELFFGREKLVDDIVGRVKESRTVFITGPSGSGKSSLVRAGLIPALKEGTIKGSDRWLYATMKPGRDPIGELGRVASSIAGSTNAGDEIRAKAMGDATIFARWCEIALKEGRDKRLVLFIDQFEEVFTQISSEDERVTFLNLLTHAATVENGRVIILFSMRSDFVSNCATYPELNALLNQQFIQIGAMQPEELVSAIAQPALRVGLPIDPDLIAQIINDMQGEPGALPLMQFALKDLFDSQQEKAGVIALTLNNYLQRGGIHKSLERHADAAFAELESHEQELARSIFSGLIEIGRGTQDTRRTALFDELVPANTKADDVEAIVQKLADARLITTDEQAGEDTVTISHEKLIDAWPWLKKLVNENRDAIALQNEITEDAKEWEDHKRDASYLYTGARLINANEQFKKQHLNLNQLAKEFVKTSQLRKRRSQGLLFSGISIVLIVSIFASVLFRNQALVNIEIAQAAQAANSEAVSQKATAQANFEEAQTQANIALARQLAAQAQSINTGRNSKQLIAVLLVIKSMKLFPTDEAASFLLNNNLAARPIAHVIHDDVVNSVAFSPDGKYVVSRSRDDTARVWEAATGKEVVRMTHVVSSVVFSPDGKYVVSGDDTTAHVWETATGKEIVRITHDAVVSSVAFSPDSKYGVSGSADKTARVWEAATGKEVAHMTHDAEVVSVAVSPDGKYVVSGSRDDTARVWETRTGKEVARINHNDWVTWVAFSPDGKYVVSGAVQDKTVRVWEAITGKEVAHMIHDDFLQSVAFSPDGKFVVSGSADTTARVWEAATGKEVARMTHDNSVWSIAFSPDGKYVASGGADKTARVWEASTGKEVARMTHDSFVNSVAFSADGKYVVSGGDTTAQVWETITGKEIARVTNDGGMPSVTFSADGKYVVSGGAGNSNTAEVWEATTSKEIARMIHGDRVNSVAFSPDGKYVVSGSQDYTARVWEAVTGKEVARMTHDSWVTCAAFSPDGKYVVSGSADKTARVWEAATGKEVARMTHDAAVSSIAFSPDGKYVVSVSWDYTARIWEAVTGKEVARMTHDAMVSSVAFSPDGENVVSGSQDYTARVWGAATGKEVARMTHNGYVTSVAFSPDGKFLVSGGDTTARVWEAATGKEVALMTHDEDEVVSSVAFSLEAKYVVSGSTDGVILVWFWQAEDLISNACMDLPRNLTRAEWKQYIGDVLPYPTKQEDATCPNLPIETEEIVTPTP